VVASLDAAANIDQHRSMRRSSWQHTHLLARADVAGVRQRLLDVAAFGCWAVTGAAGTGVGATVSWPMVRGRTHRSSNAPQPR